MKISERECGVKVGCQLVLTKTYQHYLHYLSEEYCFQYITSEGMTEQ